MIPIKKMQYTNIQIIGNLNVKTCNFSSISIQMEFYRIKLVLFGQDNFFLEAFLLPAFSIYKELTKHE